MLTFYQPQNNFHSRGKEGYLELFSTSIALDKTIFMLSQFEERAYSVTPVHSSLCASGISNLHLSLQVPGGVSISNQKVLIFFLILYEKICCSYSLDAPLQLLMSTHNISFMEK